MLLSGNNGREKPSPGIEGVRKNSRAHTGAEKQAPADLVPVLGIHRDFIALDRKRRETGVRDEAVLAPPRARRVTPNEAVSCARQADDGARLALCRAGLC